MKVTLDTLEVSTGWSGPVGATFTLNAHPNYISEYLSNSLIIHIPAGSSGVAFTKSIGPIDVSKCSEIVMSVWSRERKRVNTNDPSDFFYTVQFDASHVFMLPTNLDFESDTFGINGWASVDQITIKPTTNAEDWLIISGCYGVWDDFPLDVMEGAKLGLDHYVSMMAPNGIPIGTFTCAAGAKFIAPSSLSYLNRGAVVTLTDITHTETHQVDRFDEAAGTIWFTGLFDGPSMLYAYAGGTVGLAIPVQYGVLEQEAAVPGITIWGMATKDTQDTQDTFIVQDSMGPTGAASVRRMPWMQTFTIIVDCEARHSQTLALIARCARGFLASSKVWINGRHNEMPYPQDAVYIEPPEGIVMIPKMQYTVEIEVHEERDVRTWLSPVTGQTLTYTQKSGTLGTVLP